VVAKRQFGVSTHLYQDKRLRRDHLQEIAAFGFEVVELVAARSHFDYRSSAAVADLQQWLAETALELTTVHAPADLSTGDDAEQALFIARRMPVKAFVMHLEGSRDSARKTVERLAELAEPLGVTVALEVARDPLARCGSLVHFIEEYLEAQVGICLDFGHAHLAGDVVDAIETVSEHLIATHVHDNHGRRDDHLVPLDGAIDWPAALTAVQKVGYEGPLMMEIRAHGSTKETLARARTARQKLEHMLADGLTTD
jgi:sugar phosphate isomerase/epimerase